MIRSTIRITAPVVASIMLMMAVPGHALASAPWDPGCPAGPTSKVCIYEHWEWTGSYGNMGGDNLSYVGETFPSSTTEVNNQISSTKNLYSSLDVRWYQGTNWGGLHLCTNSGTGHYTLGWANDTYSSHDVVAGSVCQ